MIRVFLISDYALLRQGLTALLTYQAERLVLVGTAFSLDSDAPPWGDSTPDVVLLDLEINPDQILLRLKQWRNPNGPKVLLLSRHDQPALEDKAILAGASGIINQQSAPEHLLYAIEKIQQGQIWLDRQAMARLLASLPAVEPSSPPSPANEALARLSQREQRILAKMLRYSGESAREIAKRLHISESTLRNHLTSIYGKCGVSNRSGLVAYAQQHGLAELLLD